MTQAVPYDDAKAGAAEQARNIFDSDAILRRVMFIDEDVATPPSGGGGPKPKP